MENRILFYYFRLYNINKLNKEEIKENLIGRTNGKKQRIDTSFGSGFGSQSSRSIHLPKGVKSASQIDYKGNEKAVTLPTAAN